MTTDPWRTTNTLTTQRLDAYRQAHHACPVCKLNTWKTRLPMLRTQGGTMLDRLVATASQLALIVIAIVIVLAYINGFG